MPRLVAVFIHWAGMPPLEAIWELMDAFGENFPMFQLEDELFVGEGRNVVYTYARRNRTRPDCQATAEQGRPWA
jgi:hypothetical protein